MSDYTPGHALDGIGDVIGARLAATWAPELAGIVTRLYKAGQANERAALVALLRAEAEDAKSKRYWDFADAFTRAAAVIERAS